MNSSNYTKLKIASTFEALLEKTSFSRITVSMLMDESTLSRQTFYTHFTDIDDLVYWMFREHSKAGTADFYQNKDFKRSIGTFIKTMKEHQQFYQQVVSMDGPNAFKHFFYRTMLADTREHIGRYNLSEELDFVIAFFWSACTKALIDWALDGMPIPPQRLTELIYASMPEKLQFYYPKLSKT